MTNLERRCRLLLNAYPAAYRRERGEEILGTLLELTPEGRNWPPGRHVRGLLAGAVRARAAIRRRQPFSANIRTPLLVGMATFLAIQAVDDLTEYATFGRHRSSWYWHWQGTVTAPLILTAIVLAWLGRNRAHVFAAAWDAAVAQGYWLLHDPSVSARDHWAYLLWNNYPELVFLACLAGLVVLSGGTERPRPGWLVPVGLVSVVPALAFWTEFSGLYELSNYVLLGVGAACVAWMAIDARPAIAVAVFLLADWLQSPDDLLISPGLPRALIFMLIFGALVVLAEWRLSRQSAGIPSRRI